MGCPRDEYSNLANAGLKSFAYASSHVLQLTIQMSVAGTGKNINAQQLVIRQAA
jgi:hypothetical protein